METQKSPLTHKAVHCPEFRTNQISVSELKVGMYITELDRPWLETSFLFQGIDVKSAADIEEVRKYCEYVYVEERQSQVAKARQKSQVQRVPIKRPGLYPTDNVRGLGRPRKSLASSLPVRLVLFSLLLILPLQASS